MMPAFSTRNSTEPPSAPFTALVTSMVTVPIFGFGISPRGPKPYRDGRAPSSRQVRSSERVCNLGPKGCRALGIGDLVIFGCDRTWSRDITDRARNRRKGGAEVLRGFHNHEALVVEC